MVARAGLVDFVDLALDWGKRRRFDFVGADAAGRGYVGCLEIVE
jgi:hypothetical protein